jgi:hypothetical protein
MKAFVLAVVVAALIAVVMNQILVRAGFSAADGISDGNVRLDN